MDNDNEKNNKKNICKEYNSLKYRTMIMTGNNIEIPIQNNVNEDKLNNFLVQEAKNNKKQSWNKLSKTDKIKKINDYMKIIKTEYNLNSEEYDNNLKFLLNLIERRKTNKINEINYDEGTQKIIEIGLVIFNQTNRKFTLNKNLKKNDSIKKKSTVVKKKTIKKKDSKINDQDKSI